MYAITKYPTPLFNIGGENLLPPTNLSSDGRNLALETVLFPGVTVSLIKKQGHFWQLSKLEYPSSSPLYAHEGFFDILPRLLPSKALSMPSCSTLVDRLTTLVGTPYYWGGNWPEGIAVLKDFFPAIHHLGALESDYSICKGVDCSGLLYYVTEGLTPRNTSQLIDYGVNISQEDPVKPLDLVVWKGHVMIVLNPTEMIESRLKDGVIITPYSLRILEIQDMLRKENKPYFIRRWHPQQLT
jgi:hypothetical protein